MIGFNTAPVGLIPYPNCTVCPDLVSDDDACTLPVKLRAHALHFENRDGFVRAYAGGDAVSVICAGCPDFGSTCSETTPADVRVQMFVENGNVYAFMKGGRKGQSVTIEGLITLNDGSTRNIYQLVELI